MLITVLITNYLSKSLVWLSSRCAKKVFMASERYRKSEYETLQSSKKDERVYIYIYKWTTQNKGSNVDAIKPFFQYALTFDYGHQ